MIDEEKQSKYVRKVKCVVSKYTNALLAILSIKKHIESKYNGKFYFGGSLKRNNNPTQTPDIIININDEFIVGDIKRSLREKRDEERLEDYIKSFIIRDIIQQIQKYDEGFDDIPKKYDLVLIVPGLDSNQISILKFDYLEKDNKVFNNKFCLLKYNIEHGANTLFVLINKEYGELNNSSLLEDFKRTIKIPKGLLDDEQGKYKIYEEAETAPLEYIMLILWVNIFPELLKMGSTKSLLERYEKREKEEILETTLDELVTYLNKMYTLPKFNSDNNSFQFEKDKIKVSMKLFSKLDMVEIIDEDSINPKYRVKYRKLPEREELDYLTKRIYGTANSIERLRLDSSEENTLRDFV